MSTKGGLGLVHGLDHLAPLPFHLNETEDFSLLTPLHTLRNGGFISVALGGTLGLDKMTVSGGKV